MEKKYRSDVIGNDYFHSVAVWLQMAKKKNFCPLWHHLKKKKKKKKSSCDNQKKNFGLGEVGSRTRSYKIFFFHTLR